MNTNCGTPTHPPDCYCDVALDAEEIPINYGSHEMWHGEAIVRALGIAVPWTSVSLEKFGESLCRAHDIWERQRHGHGGRTVEGEALRAAILDELRAGESMIDLARLLDVPFKTILETLTRSQPAVCWNWDEAEWLHVEAVIYDHFADNGNETLATMLGVHKCVVESLAEWYGVKINENGQDRIDRLKRLLLDGLHPVDAAKEANAQGIVANNEQMYKLRQGMRERGEVSMAMPRRLVVS